MNPVGRLLNPFMCPGFTDFRSSWLIPHVAGSGRSMRESTGWENHETTARLQLYR